MLFNSFPFLLGFLPLTVAAYALLGRGPGGRVAVLLVASLLFYGWWDARFVPVLAGGIVINWLAARRIAARRGSRAFWAVVGLDLLVLAGFKYTDAVTGPLGIAIPLGISFFTFHHIMYLADLRRGRAPLAPLGRYALYIAFFPQALAGPLARWSEVGAQFGRPMFAAGWERRWALGVAYIVFGLVEKVALGDPLGQVLDPVYAAAARGAVPDGLAWLAPGFAFQVLFDFAGYCDVAIGAGLLFGVELPSNFNAPFRAASILEFWTRWHMTLGRFLRDYVFLPLADLRIAGTRHTVPQYVAAIMVTMSLCGLWHGASGAFVLWGALQGAAMVVALGWRRRVGRPPRAVGWAATVAFFLMTAPLFRAGSLEAAWHLYAGMGALPRALGHAWLLGVAGVLAVLLPSSKALCGAMVERAGPWVPVGLGLAGVALLVQLGGTESYDFIYFRF